jgi:uncharacterized protein (TIGR02246 family)
MDGFVTVPVDDLPEVFGRLIEPRHLGSWLPDVRRVQPEPGAVGVPFAMLLRDGIREVPGTGELVACEPPRHAVFRFHTADAVSVVRVTCTRTGQTTRVHVRQEEQALRAPLRIDLDKLRQLLSADLNETHVRAGDADRSAGHDDEAAVSAITSRLQHAFAAGNAQDLDDLYAVDADWVNASGTVGKGSAGITNHLRGLFADGGAAGRPAGPPDLALRQVGADVVVVSVRTQIPGQRRLDGGETPVRENHSLHVLQRNPGSGWRIVSEMYMHARQDTTSAGADHHALHMKQH